MPVLRRGSASPKEAQILLSDTSPYGSRVFEVESDGVTTAAYLRRQSGETIAAAWLANHLAAPQNADLVRLNAGQVPAMPASRTKHPRGRAPLLPANLEVVWFEEGDGAALLESGGPLCVIPGWSDMDHGAPGYSRDVIGQTPFAFALDDEINELGPRIRKAQRFWEWRRGPKAWAGFQQGVLGHLLGRLGPGGYYWHDVGSQWAARDGGAADYPLVGVSERPAREDRPYGVLSTVGMSCQRMPTVELFEENVAEHSRIELAVATTLPSQRAGSIFPWLAQYPWRVVTSFADGDNIRWYHDAQTFPLGSGWEGVLLLDDPSRLGGPPAPDMSAFTFAGDPVRWLWLVPITETERQLAKDSGPEALVERLAKDGRSWVVG